jgi:cell division protein FtsW
MVAITAMMLQVVLGSESGVAGAQPVEFAKLALLAGSAYALAYLRRWESWNLEIHPWRLWAVMLMPIVLMLGLITLVLFLLRDFSPLVLILFWAFAAAWAYQYSLPDVKKRWLGLVSLSLIAVGGVVSILILKQHPDWLNFLAQSDRILTWAQPHLHPHSGDQVHQAISVLRDGARFGQWLNGVPLTVGVNPDPVMSVAAIQDDFILAFALNKMGIAGGLAILLLQLMLVGALITIAHNLTRTHVIQGQGDYHRITLGWFGYFFLYGGAGFLLGHIVVSWGTNSGLLPVMGQPSPFISAAGSHLVFFIFPLLITSVVIDHHFDK